MHGHGPIGGVGSLHAPSHLELQRTAAAEQAAAVRRKLKESVESMEPELSTEGEFMVRRWAGGGGQRQQRGREGGKDGPDEQMGGEPVSVWA